MRTFNKASIIFSLLLIAITTLTAQTWDSYHTDNSPIPGNSVNDVVTDNAGNQWIATTSGLAKFTGNDWVVYKTDNSGLPSNFVRSLAVHPVTGDIWMGTNFGVARYNRIGQGEVGWTVYNSTNTQLPRDAVESVAINSNGIVWIGMLGGGGLARLIGSNWTFYTTSNSGLPNNFVYALDVDEINTVWIGTNSGLASFNGANWNIFNTGNSYLIDDSIRSLAVFNGTDIAVGTNSGGLAVLENGVLTVYHTGNSIIPSNSVSAVAVKDNGIIWAGTSSLGLFKLSNMRITRYDTINSGLISDNIKAIAIDNNQKKWICTTGGLSVYDEISVTDVVIIPDQLVLEEGESYQLEIEISPEDATNHDIRWITFDETVATVDVNGYVTAHRGGETIIKVFTDDSSYDAECLVIVTGTVANPTFTPEPGDYVNNISVQINTGTQNASIYYTLDQTEPTTDSHLYSQPIEIGSQTTIKAKAFKEYWQPSEIVTATYNFATAVEDDTYPDSISGKSDVYPNPLVLSAMSSSSDRIIISYQANANEPVNINIFDIKGRKIRQYNETSSLSGDNSFSFTVSGSTESRLAPGIYFYTIEEPSRTMRGKFSIIR